MARRCERLGAIATYALIHDREIANRVDDSVVRVMAGASASAAPRARLCAGADRAAAGFETAPELLAMGGELKATFCLVKDGEAILSQHQGDLENADDLRRLSARTWRSMPSCSTTRRSRSSPTGIPNICRPSSPANGRERERCR